MTARTTKGLRIATRCTSIDQFVAAFHRFCDAQTCFISTLTMRPVGLETAFSIDLANGQPALRGLGIVNDAWPTPGNRYGRPGLLLGIKKLTADSEKVLARLRSAHVAATPPPTPAAAMPAIVVAAKPKPPAIPSLPPIAPPALADPSSLSITKPLPLPEVVTDGERTPGSDLVLPANPLMNISDHSLEGFVDCTIYEETGNFFPVDDPEPSADADPPIEPPVLAARRMTVPPMMAMPAPMPAMATLPMTGQPMPAMPTPLPMPLDRPMIRRELDSEPMPSHMPPALMPQPPMMRPAFPRASGIGKRRVVIVSAVAVVTLGVVMAVAAARSDEPAAAKSPAPPPATAAAPPPAAAATPPLVVEADAPPPHRSSPPAQRPAVVADVAPPRPAVAAADPADADPADSPDSPSTGSPMFGSGPCKIAVSTTPAGSIVTVDGEVAGPSPITIGGPCARRKLDIAHPRYAPATRLVTATPNAAIDVALARPTHDLYVETTPPGAVVSIDGHRAGTSPTLVKVMGFTTLSLRIEKFGWRPVTQKVYSKAPNDRIAIRLGH